MLDSNTLLRSPEEFGAGFDYAVQELRVGRRLRDNHVHIMPLSMGEQFALFGLHQAGAYHYLDGEAGARDGLSREQQVAHGKLSVQDRAMANLDSILGDGSLPVSTAALGWLKMAKALGLDPSKPHREILREWDARFGGMTPQDYHDYVWGLSGIEAVVSTQSIFVPAEAKLYLTPTVMDTWDNRYEVGIRVDEALRWIEQLRTSAALAGLEAAAGDPDDASTREALNTLIERYFELFAGKTNVRYLSASLGAEDRFYLSDGRPSQSRFAVVLRDVIIPLAKKLGLSVYVMPFVERKVNPAAGASGDCLSFGDPDDLRRFISEHPEVKFILSPLNPALNNWACFLSRACPNVSMIGFWWGNLNSNEVCRQIQERLEFIGTAWFGFNSDARILDQLLYKWDDFFADLKLVFVDILLPKLAAVGVPISVGSIQTTIENLFNSDRLSARVS